MDMYVQKIGLVFLHKYSVVGWELRQMKRHLSVCASPALLFGTTRIGPYNADALILLT